MPTTHRAHFTGRPWLASLCVAAGLAGCSSPPRPNAQLAVGAASVEAAQAAGASEGAQIDLNSAQVKLSRAQAAERAGDRVLARRLAEEADADAQVARSRADAEKSRKAADEIDASLRTLRQELNRPAGRPGTAPAANQ